MPVSSASHIIRSFAPGGVGSGLYGMLVLAIVAVFVCGLMVGRTPELLGKKIGSREMTYVALYTLVVPALVLVGIGATTLSMAPTALADVRAGRAVGTTTPAA